MRTTVITCATLLVCGLAYGQETPSNYEHLKSYEQLIGTWEYDGPVLEGVPDIVVKGDVILLRQTVKWILDKNAVEVDFYIEVKGSDFKQTAKSLIGWDVANNKIIRGGLNSNGGHSFATIVYDDEAKSWTGKNQGVNGDKEATSSTGVITLQGKDAYVLQLLDRKGGDLEGDSPKYVFRRVKRPKQPHVLKEAK